MTIAIWATVIATIVSSSIACIVAWFLTKRTERIQERSALEDMLSKTIDIAIEYPYLEDNNFCENWLTTDKTSEKAMRYDNYCCLVFNFMERTWRHFKGNREQILKFFYMPEFAKRHRKWWRSEPVNVYAYDIRFREFINSFIEDKQ